MDAKTSSGKRIVSEHKFPFLCFLLVTAVFCTYKAEHVFFSKPSCECGPRSDKCWLLLHFTQQSLKLILKAFDRLLTSETMRICVAVQDAR